MCLSLSPKSLWCVKSGWCEKHGSGVKEKEREREQLALNSIHITCHLGSSNPFHFRIATEMLLVLFLLPFFWNSNVFRSCPFVILSLVRYFDKLTWVRFLRCHTLRLFALKLVLSFCNTSIFISIYCVVKL